MHTNNDEKVFEEGIAAAATSQPPAEHARAQPEADDVTEAMLDEALDETFPASDPVSISPRAANLPAAGRGEWKK